MPTITTAQVRFRTVGGVQIRCADSGGLREPAVVLASPWPESVYAFAPMWDDGDRFARVDALWPQVSRGAAVLAGLLPEITVPVTIINGRHDRGVPLANAEFLDQRLPASCLVIIDAGHLAWAEAPTRREDRCGRSSCARARTSGAGARDPARDRRQARPGKRFGKTAKAIEGGNSGTRMAELS